ncbi:unnamed protein product [Hymenolepis diminuta]|uniref:Uncharacterized protein n=1 Tax=Hymenolepis diminuta TaxID=6216 RepID=A0A564YYN7_HYMDI|nr:unnamed protein product [Hymenolepis diminuta]
MIASEGSIEKEKVYLSRKSEGVGETTTKQKKCGRTFGEILRDLCHFCPILLAILTILGIGIFLLVIFSDAIFSSIHDYLKRFS